MVGLPRNLSTMRPPSLFKRIGILGAPVFLVLDRDRPRLRLQRSWLVNVGQSRIAQNRKSRESRKSYNLVRGTLWETYESHRYRSDNLEPTLMDTWPLLLKSSTSKHDFPNDHECRIRRIPTHGQ